MSSFATRMVSVGSALKSDQGEAITYNVKDAVGDTSESHAIEKAIVSPWRSGSYQDEDGRIFAAALSVRIQKADLAVSLAENDTITWDGSEWIVREWKDEPGSYMLIAARHERRETTGPAARHERRMPSSGLQADV